MPSKLKEKFSVPCSVYPNCCWILLLLPTLIQQEMIRAVIKWCNDGSISSLDVIWPPHAPFLQCCQIISKVSQSQVWSNLTAATTGSCPHRTPACLSKNQTLLGFLLIGPSTINWFMLPIPNYMLLHLLLFLVASQSLPPPRQTVEALWYHPEEEKQK